MLDMRCKDGQTIHMVRAGVKEEGRNCGERPLRLQEALTSRSRVLGTLRF